MTSEPIVQRGVGALAEKINIILSQQVTGSRAVDGSIDELR